MARISGVDIPNAERGEVVSVPRVQRTSSQLQESILTQELRILQKMISQSSVMRSKITTQLKVNFAVK